MLECESYLLRPIATINCGAVTSIQAESKHSTNTLHRYDDAVDGPYGQIRREVFKALLQ